VGIWGNIRDNLGSVFLKEEDPQQEDPRSPSVQPQSPPPTQEVWTVHHTQIEPDKRVLLKLAQPLNDGVLLGFGVALGVTAFYFVVALIVIAIIALGRFAIRLASF